MFLHMKPLLLSIFEALEEKRIVKNQLKFAEKLNYNRGYMNKLLKADKPIPPALQDLLHDIFGISREYMRNGGKDAPMFDTREKEIDVNDNDNSELNQNYSTSSQLNQNEPNMTISNQASALNSIARSMEILAKSNAELVKELLSYRQEQGNLNTGR